MAGSPRLPARNMDSRRERGTGFASARKTTERWELGTPERTQSSGWVISHTTSGLIRLWSSLPPAVGVEVDALKQLTALASNGSRMV